MLVETWQLVSRRLGREAAERYWEGLRTGIALIECVGAGDLESAWAIGVVFPDQDFSIVDRTSFALMQRLGVLRAATLDADFRIYRFGPRRDRAFHVIP